MSNPTENSKHHEGSLHEAPWNKKSTGYFETTKEAVFQMVRLDNDLAAKYYGDLAFDCLKYYKPKMTELWGKAKWFDDLPPNERYNVERYETEEERKVVTCLNNVMKEKTEAFQKEYKEREMCIDKCEILYPRSSGAKNFMNRHSCRRECEGSFTASVKPKINEIDAQKKEAEKLEKEHIRE